MKLYTINRNGEIPFHGDRTEHYCGDPDSNVYGYHTEIDVIGDLACAPNEFIIDNRDIDAAIQALFTGMPKGRSCERMADMICSTLIKIIPACWTVRRVRAELTGTNGVAWLAATWTPDTDFAASHCGRAVSHGV